MQDSSINVNEMIIGQINISGGLWLLWWLKIGMAGQGSGGKGGKGEEAGGREKGAA